MTVGAWNGRPQPDIDIWGPWQTVMEEAVVCCDNHVQSLRDALRSRRSEDLERFRLAANALFNVSSELTERCEDHERWIVARARGYEMPIPPSCWELSSEGS